jgi:hypothetical protein
MQLTSSQAHKLTSSQAHKLTSLPGNNTRRAFRSRRSVPALSVDRVSGRITTMLSVLLLGLLAGCISDNGPIDDTPKVHVSADADTVKWYAGILLPLESTAVTFPLDAPGVHRASDIASVSTSCDCINAAPREFIDMSGERQVAIRLESTTENLVDTPNGRTASLAVMISVLLTTGHLLERHVHLIITDITPGGQ